MTTTRLEAFSDAVIAIIITIMVLEFKVPHGTQLEDLMPLLPVFTSYVLSFVYIGIYWNNHHHLLHAAEKVDGHILWANLHLLFWLSLFPFVTAWMGENEFATVPMAAYGLVLLCAALSYTILVRTLIARHGREFDAGAVDRPGRQGLGIDPRLSHWNCTGALSSLCCPGLIYAGVAAMWIVPDPRIERNLAG